MNVLVTGGAGFLGSHTADALVKKGHRVTILDHLTKPVHPKGRWPSYLSSNIRRMRGDIRRKKDWVDALKGIDVVYHFAAYQDYRADFSTYFDVNCKGTALLYEVIVEKKFPIKKVILSSSQAVYGEGRYRCSNHGVVFPTQRLADRLKKNAWDVLCPLHQPACKLTPQWTREDDPLRPHNAYAMSKRAQEELTLNLGRRYNISTIALRYSIVQGARQSPFNPYSGALRQFVISLTSEKTPTIYEDGEQRRDFVNIHDVVGVHLLALTDERMNFEVFNVGGGKAISVNSLYRKVRASLKTNVEPRRDGSYREGDTRTILSSIAKLKHLGWSPRYTVDDSVQEYVEWIKKDLITPHR